MPSSSLLFGSWPGLFLCGAGTDRGRPPRPGEVRRWTRRAHLFWSGRGAGPGSERGEEGKRGGPGRGIETATLHSTVWRRCFGSGAALAYLAPFHSRCGEALVVRPITPWLTNRLAGGPPNFGSNQSILNAIDMVRTCCPVVNGVNPAHILKCARAHDCTGYQNLGLCDGVEKFAGWSPITRNRPNPDIYPSMK